LFFLITIKASDFAHLLFRQKFLSSYIKRNTLHKNYLFIIQEGAPQEIRKSKGKERGEGVT